MKDRSAVYGRISHHLTSGWVSKLITALFLILSLTVIGLILANNWETIESFEWQIRPVWLVYIFIFFVIDLLVATWVWHLLVVRLANYRNFRQSAKICWWANLARRIPTPVWYIAGRAMMYEKVGISKTTTSLLSTLELLFFLLSGLATTLLTLPFWAIPPELSQNVNPWLLLILLLPLSVLFIHPRLLEKLWRRLRPEIPLEPLHWQDTITWLGYYILTWVFGALVLFSLLNLLYPLPLTELMAVIGIWSLAGSISLAGSLTISVIGVREISLILLLTILVPAPIALIAAILIRVIWLLGEMLSAIVSFKL
jgi:glycosyltransferase 2 family protein